MKRKELSNRAIGYIVVIISIILVLSFFSFGYTDLINGEITNVRVSAYVRDVDGQRSNEAQLRLSPSEIEAIANELSELKGYKTKEKSKLHFEAIFSYDVAFDVQTKNGKIGAVITFSNKSTTLSLQTSDPSIAENGVFKLKRFITQKQHNKMLNEIFKDVLVLE